MSSCNALLTFFFKDTATTEIYPLSLHDPLPILRQAPRRASRLSSQSGWRGGARARGVADEAVEEADRPLEVGEAQMLEDRKSTRLNSSHANISYAVFCLKKKNR